MTEHRNKGKPGYRGWFPGKPLEPVEIVIAEVAASAKASAAEIAALNPEQRRAFMAGLTMFF